MTDLQRLITEAVAMLLPWSPRGGDNALLEQAEPVLIENAPGVEVRWTQVMTDQGIRRFGLLIAATELIAELGGAYGPVSAEDVAARLRIAVAEPHATAASPSLRTWYRTLP